MILSTQKAVDATIAALAARAQGEVVSPKALGLDEFRGLLRADEAFVQFVADEKSISALVEEIQSETERTVHAVEDGARATSESAATVEEAREAFQQIGVSVEEMTVRIAQIVEATNEVAAVAEQSSAATEQVSASTDETSSSAARISDSAQGLAATAQELQALFRKLHAACDQVAEFEEFVFVANQDRACELVAVHNALFIVTL